MASYEVVAQSRKEQGTGASRRLRLSGRVPAIVYGGKKDAESVDLDHNAIWNQLRHEKFHASILSLVVDGKPQQVLLRSVNMHPWKAQVQHVDFQRIAADEKIRMKVPLHFSGAESSPAVKGQSATVSHILNEIEIRCLPADLPEFIPVDLSGLTVGNTVHVKDLLLPKGVEVVLRGKENPAVVICQVPRASADDELTAAPSAADVPAAKQKAPDAAAKDAPAKK